MNGVALTTKEKKAYTIVPIEFSIARLFFMASFRVCVKTVSIPYVYHTTVIREDTKASQAWFVEHQKDQKDYVLPEKGKFPEDLSRPMWFMLSEHGFMPREGVSSVFLQYEVKRPLKLQIGKSCAPCLELDGYARRYNFGYELCLFRPSECLKTKYVQIQHPETDPDGDTIQKDLDAVEEWLKLHPSV